MLSLLTLKFKGKFEVDLIHAMFSYYRKVPKTFNMAPISLPNGYTYDVSTTSTCYNEISGTSLKFK